MQTVMDYGEIHNDPIMSMVLTPDSKFLYTACMDGELKQWEIIKKKLWKNFGEIEKKSIKCMAILVNQSQILTHNYHATHGTASIEN
jgi:WD40 repeat protein